jgi:hypothetical protein
MGVDYADLRVIQYNLQIDNAARIDPEKMAQDVFDHAANAIVINVGGIYAWYHSQIPFHHINEYLPENRELLEEIIEACHRKGILVIGRFDFSKTDDTTYLMHPEWFVKTRNGEPLCYGSKRMGNWSLLLSTCINAGYRNQDFAEKVLKEALGRFDLDGVFFNAPQMERCHCESCREKYFSLYGKELPDEPGDWEPGWMRQCFRDNLSFLYRAVKEVKPDVPVILYYGTYNKNGGKPENLSEIYSMADYICTEAQNILSKGRGDLPYRWSPMLKMKLGRAHGNRPAPFGIIHSCPGMDWRHTGMPAAEYAYWLSEIPAAGGRIWHSLTGFDDVITDRRILDVITEIDERSAVSDTFMGTAESCSGVLLFWNADKASLGFAEGLFSSHIQFDVADPYHPESADLSRYSLLIIPDSFPFTEEWKRKIKDYLEEGGNVLAEAVHSSYASRNRVFLGLENKALSERNLTASYGKLEDPGRSAVGYGLERVKYLPVRGNVLCLHASEESFVPMTLIPPFAPADGVGAPPERAILPVSGTDIPLLEEKRIGRGRMMLCYVDLPGMLMDYGLDDWYQMLTNLSEYLGGGIIDQEKSEILPGVLVSVFRDRAQRQLLIHLVNTTGERPLRRCNVCRDMKITLRKGSMGRKISVFSAFTRAPLEAVEEDEELHIHIGELKVWDLIVVRFE